MIRTRSHKTNETNQAYEDLRCKPPCSQASRIQFQDCRFLTSNHRVIQSVWGPKIARFLWGQDSRLIWWVRSRASGIQEMHTNPIKIT